MIQRQLRFKLIGFFVGLLVLDWVLYFRHAGHFFQGDTLFWLSHRAHTVAEYLREFSERNSSGWYRPLANDLIESILYPFAGLNPIPYRIPVYGIFAAITIAVYALGVAVTGRRLAAVIAVFFFTIHTVNSYTTYDLAFLPELLYSLFYIVAVLAYLRYVESASKTAYVVSLVCFVGGLLSKEPALTLPATLFLAHILFGARELRRRWIPAIRSIVPHAIVLIAYLAFAFAYLNVMGFSVSKLFDSSQKPNPGDYIAVINDDVFKTADLALTWAFNMPGGGWGQPQALNPGMLRYLKFFRATVFLLAAGLLFAGIQRKALVFGVAWFWITLIPALPLVGHFFPYYLFLPIVGLSLITGVAFAWLYDFLSRFQPVLAGATVVLLFAGVLYATARVIKTEIRDNYLLGGAAKLAANTLSDLKAFYPVLPAPATLYFADANEPLAWPHGFGGLINMAYGTDRLSELYQSEGAQVFPESQKAFAFEIHNGRLSDETNDYRSNPGKFLKFAPSELELALSASDVAAGRDNYTLSIKGLRDVEVRIAYNINAGPLEVFQARLDANGEVTFDVGRGTRPGVYRFWGFSTSAGDDWIRSEQTLTVH